MATVDAKNQHLTAIVTFDVAPNEQDHLANLVIAYVDNFISQQAGCISANVHKSICGKRVVNYAQWQSMDHFKAFADKAKSRPELPELISYQPQASFYEVIHSVDGKSETDG